MFKFIDSKKKQITNHEKGKLFEKFLREFIQANGYRIIHWRAKYNSLEYDIVAQPTLDLENKIIIEAKAMQRKIDNTIITSFGGKMIPHWDENESTLGLFISISELTQEAQDWLRKTEQTKNFKTIVGDNIINNLSKSSNFLTFEQVKKKCIHRFNLNAGDTYFCISDRGFYFIQLLIPKNKTLVEFFTVLSSLGEIIDETEFYDILKSRIKELTNLKPCALDNDLKGNNKQIQISMITEEKQFLIESGLEWFDYKLPASPEYFIGRESNLEKFFEYINQYKTRRTKISILQILSKSGVGKTSFILKAESLIDSTDDFSIVIDIRDINSTLDLIKITQKYVKKLNNELKLNFELPLTFKRCNEFFIDSNKILKEHKRYTIINLDQFESIIFKTGESEVIFDFFFSIVNQCSQYYLVVTRKSDLIVSLDEKVNINLEKLNNHSYSILLPDFNKEDSIEMISKLHDYFKRNVNSELTQAILERSNGFPWLHKRICYHVLRLYNKGMSQDNIIKSGLSIEDLFKEELEQLDELDKDFLKKVVQYLPANLNDLDEIFEDDEHFKNRIRKLRNFRIIRLKGNTLDTYNDFFKEYIINGKVPLKKKYILKIGPGAIEKWFSIIVNKGYRNIDMILQNETIKKGTLYNNLAEMKNLELIEYYKGKIVVNMDAEISLKKDKFKTFLKSKLLENDLFNGKNGIIDKASRKQELDLNDIVNILHEMFPVVDREKDTWKNYAKTIIRWLLYCDIDIDLDLDITKLKLINRRKKKYFFPEISMNKVIEIMEEFSTNPSIKKSYFINKAKRNEKALLDLRTINFINHGKEGYILTDLGKEFLDASPNKRREIIEKICYSWANIRDFLELIKNNPNQNAFQVFGDLEQAVNWSYSTREVFFRKLRSWLLYSKLVIKSRKRLLHRDNIQTLITFIKKLKM